MEISYIDAAIILIYLISVALIGSLSGGKQKTTKDYFMGGKNVPWWAVSFSIVAAETSSLTFISIPGLAYLTNLNFLQLTLGYLIARILVAVFFLPSYRKGELATAYTFLENRFGSNPKDLPNCMQSSSFAFGLFSMNSFSLMLKSPTILGTIGMYLGIIGILFLFDPADEVPGNSSPLQ